MGQCSSTTLVTRKQVWDQLSSPYTRIYSPWSRWPRSSTALPGDWWCSRSVDCTGTGNATRIGDFCLGQVIIVVTLGSCADWLKLSQSSKSLLASQEEGSSSLLVSLLLVVVLWTSKQVWCSCCWCGSKWHWKAVWDSSLVLLGWGRYLFIHWFVTDYEVEIKII